MRLFSFNTVLPLLAYHDISIDCDCVVVISEARRFINLLQKYLYAKQWKVINICQKLRSDILNWRYDDDVFTVDTIRWTNTHNEGSVAERSKALV